MKTEVVVGKLLGWSLGVVFASVIHTWLGLTILGYLGWMP